MKSEKGKEKEGRKIRVGGGRKVSEKVEGGSGRGVGGW